MARKLGLSFWNGVGTLGLYVWALSISGISFVPSLAWVLLIGLTATIFYLVKHLVRG